MSATPYIDASTNNIKQSIPEKYFEKIKGELRGKSFTVIQGQAKDFPLPGDRLCPIRAVYVKHANGELNVFYSRSIAGVRAIIADFPQYKEHKIRFDSIKL